MPLNRKVLGHKCIPELAQCFANYVTPTYLRHTLLGWACCFVLTLGVRNYPTNTNRRRICFFFASREIEGKLNRRENNRTLPRKWSWSVSMMTCFVCYGLTVLYFSCSTILLQMVDCAQWILEAKYNSFCVRRRSGKEGAGGFVFHGPWLFRVRGGIAPSGDSSRTNDPAENRTI